ncbi:MAG: ArsC/Spx/MgsR family protein [Crocinitomix sp.]|nr:ArsC/Spx/MgsR family protein [Crocinitomix sp.]
MKKIYYLKTCSTCQRIMKEWNVDDSFELQNIKEDRMTGEQVDQMIEMAGSAAALFSKRSMKYRAMGLHERELSESEMRQFIIDEYTFLSRPVLILGDSIFVGNSKKVVAAATEALNG